MRSSSCDISAIRSQTEPNLSQNSVAACEWEIAVAALDLVFLYHVLRESFRGPRVAPVGEVPTAIRGPGGPWHPGRDPFILGPLLGPYSRLRVKPSGQVLNGLMLGGGGATSLILSPY